MAELLKFGRRKGFSLIDVIVGVSLLLIVFIGIFAAYQLGFQVVGQSKNRIIATAIANAEVEKIRNLPYQSIGVQGSFPDGILIAENEIVQNNVRFKIERRVDYVIDPADGIALPDDECPNDYKKAEVKVSSLDKFRVEVLMVTDIVPKNLAQECAGGGGILSVSVFDAFGAMVSSPLIEIKNPSTDQTVKTALPAEGKHYFSLAPGTYKVVVSKSGYSQERTYGSEEVTTPVNPHPIVLEGQLIEISLSIDKLSSMTIQTRGTQELGYPIISNITFNLRGEKIIGRNESGKPVYKYSQNHTTNSSGQVTVSNLEWDSYSFSVVSPNLNLVAVESPPETAINQPLSLGPNTNLTVRLILSAENSLLITVKNVETQEPVFSAKVRLSNTDLGYDITQYTNESGKTYFIPLESAVYNIEVEAAGYSQSSDQVSVSGQTLKTINLQQIE
jgi:hypothetical protein